MKENITPAFIRAIPKSDLHLHLDGSLRLPTLIELSRKAKCKLPSYSEAGMRKLVFKESYKDLPDYLHGFMYTCAVLLDLDNLSRVAQELVEDNIAEGVRYIEVRFAPQLHVTPTTTVTDVVRAVAKGLAAGAKAHNASKAVRSGADLPFYSGMIVCGMRRFKKGMSPYYGDLLRLMQHAPKDEVYAAASLELARAAVELSRACRWSASTWPEKRRYPRPTTEAPVRPIILSARPCMPANTAGIDLAGDRNVANHRPRHLFHEEMIGDPSVADRRVRRRPGQLRGQPAHRYRVCVTSNLRPPSIKTIAKHPINA